MAGGAKPRRVQAPGELGRATKKPRHKGRRSQGHKATSPAGAKERDGYERQRLKLRDEVVVTWIRTSRTERVGFADPTSSPCCGAHLDIVRPPAHPPTMPGTCKYLILHFL